MKLSKYFLAALVGFTLLNTIPVYAGQWEKIGSGWYYEQDGQYLASDWYLIDGRWYYFNAAGLMASDEVIDGYYVGEDGAWDGKEADLGPGEEWMGNIRLITNEMRGGIACDYDVDAKKMVARYNQEKQYFVARLEDGQGVGIKNVIMDVYGNIIANGYEDALWMRKDGYLRIKYCYPGTEQEADGRNSMRSDVYKIAMGSMEGSTYLELYDWSGALIDKQYLGSGKNAISEARKKYPSENPACKNVLIKCTPVDGGFLITDTQGQKAQLISMENSSKLKWKVVGNLLEFYNLSGLCEGIYWIQ